MTIKENRNKKTEVRKWNLKSILVSRFLFLFTSHSRGFILPFAMILAYIILIISMGISDILTKEMYFSYVGRESQIAYYAADAGLDCALYIDTTFFDSATGIGIFPYNTIDGTWEKNVINNPPYSNSPYNLNDTILASTVKCAGSEIFNSATDGTHSSYSATSTDGSNPVNGVTTTFTLHMDQGHGSVNTKDSCVKISIEKKLVGEDLTRTIISRGENTCDSNSPKFVERAIVNTQ